MIQTIAILAFGLILGGVGALLGYALGMTRGEHDGARRERVLNRAWSRIECEPPAVSPAPEPVTVTSPDVAVVSNSGGATAVSGAAVAVEARLSPESRRPPRTSPRGPKGAATSL